MTDANSTYGIRGIALASKQKNSPALGRPRSTRIRGRGSGRGPGLVDAMRVVLHVQSQHLILRQIAQEIPMRAHLSQAAHIAREQRAALVVRELVAGDRRLGIALDALPELGILLHLKGHLMDEVNTHRQVSSNTLHLTEVVMGVPGK